MLRTLIQKCRLCQRFVRTRKKHGAMVHLRSARQILEMMNVQIGKVGTGQNKAGGHFLGPLVSARGITMQIVPKC